MFIKNYIKTKCVNGCDLFNDSSKYGNTYSSTSVFNDSASNPPKIFSEDGFLGYLSIGPSWNSERFNPYDFKYTCDWD